MEKIVCNICGCPREVTYQEQDHETGKVRIARHTVDCGGHIGIHPSLWNKAGGNSSGGVRSLGYSEYEKYYQQLAKERPHVEKNETRIEDLGKRKEKKRKERKPRKDNFKGHGKKRVFPVRSRKTR